MGYSIVVSGYYGFKNAGDEAILFALLKSFEKQLPGSSITVFSGNPVETSERYDVKSVHRFNLFGIAQSLYNADLLLSGGGSLLQDVTSWRSLLYYLSILVLGKVFGCKVVLYGQGIGPIQRNWLRTLTGMILKHMDLILVRDKDSADFLGKLGVPGRSVQLTADAVFLLDRVKTDDGKVLLSRYGMSSDSNIIAVAVRAWHRDKYLGALVDALDILADKGNKLLLIPLQYPADLLVTRKLQRALRHDAKMVEQECTTEELLSLIGCAKTVVGMRLHSLVFSAVMGIPFVALDYDPKITGFVDLVGGVCAGNIDDVTTEGIVEAYSLAQNIHVELQPLRDKARLNNCFVTGLLERREKSAQTDRCL